jgi:hypothetical protein
MRDLRLIRVDDRLTPEVLKTGAGDESGLVSDNRCPIPISLRRHQRQSRALRLLLIDF